MTSLHATTAPFASRLVVASLYGLCGLCAPATTAFAAPQQAAAPATNASSNPARQGELPPPRPGKAVIRPRLAEIDAEALRRARESLPPRPASAPQRGTKN